MKVMNQKRWLFLAGIWTGLLLVLAIESVSALDFTFPAGGAPFADRVISAEVSGDLEQAAAVLGAPDDDGFLLSDGARLVIEFVDNALVASGDDLPDLAIVEDGEPLAVFTVAVSRDGVFWEPVGTLGPEVRSVDLDAFEFGGSDRFRFVELVDLAGDSTEAKIDAIGVLHSVPLDGGVSAIFDHPSGGGDLVVAGVGSSFFMWGEATDTPFPSSLEFRPSQYSGGIEEEFDLGTVTFINGTNAKGTTADAVDFIVTLDAGGDEEPTEFVFRLELVSTSNGGTAFQDADIVRLPNPYSETEVVLLGEVYRLQLSFEAATAGGVAEVDRFFTVEGTGASAVLRAVLTTRAALDGCQPQRLTFDHGNESQPAWDPRGGMIAYKTNREAGDNIGAIDVDRTRERLQAVGLGSNNGGLVSSELSWLGETGRLLTLEAFSVREALEFDTAKGIGYRELANGDEGSSGNETFLSKLRFSSGGSFFLVSRDGSTALWKEWDGMRSSLRAAGYAILFGQIAAETGVVQKEITGAGSHSIMHSAALSTDGEFIVLSEEVDEGRYDLFRFDSGAGMEPELLTEPGTDEGMSYFYPAISPDGRRIAFAGVSSASANADIFVLELATGNMRNLTMTPEVNETHPDWSPDGGALVYSRYDALNSPQLRTNEPANWNLYVQCVEEINDRDDDGVVDLLEEAFGSDPNAPDRTQLPEIVTTVEAGIMRVGVTFSVQKEGVLVAGGAWRSGGIEYTIQVSEDLVSWMPGSEDLVSMEITQEGALSSRGRERLSATLLQPVEMAETPFLRVRVRRYTGVSQ